MFLQLNQIAEQRGQTMAQLALVWILRLECVTSVLIGASKVSQIEDAVGIANNVALSDEEIATIENILNGG